MSNATFGTYFETNHLPIYIRCEKCQNTWNRAFIPNKRISCSKCKTSIVLPDEIEYNRLKDQTMQRVKASQSDNPGAEVLYTIPNALLNDTKFSRALSWARTNGDDMLFYSNDECMLSLVH